MYRCHDQSYCSACHNRFPMGSLRIKSHLMLGPNGQNITHCNRRTLHRGAEKSAILPELSPRRRLVCIQCHSSGKVRPHPRNWRSGNFKDRTNGKSVRTAIYRGPINYGKIPTKEEMRMSTRKLSIMMLCMLSLAVFLYGCGSSGRDGSADIKPATAWRCKLWEIQPASSAMQQRLIP